MQQNQRVFSVLQLSSAAAPDPGADCPSVVLAHSYQFEQQGTSGFAKKITKPKFLFDSKRLCTPPDDEGQGVLVSLINF